MREHNARNRFYRLKQWRAVRAGVLKRDGYVCQLKLVGCTGLATIADHIVEWRDGGSDDEENLRAVCASCHNVPARYEVHLDRKLERTLAMLIRLRELRPAAVPG